MSREIKFRAWDKERKEFLSAGNILLAINPNRYPKNTDFYLDVYNEKYKNMWRDRFEIQQFTGLFDKNAREIYDGDIVRTNSGRLCKVVWFSSPQYQGWDLTPIETKSPASTEVDFWNNLEVIGNVYENKNFEIGYLK